MVAARAWLERIADRLLGSPEDMDRKGFWQLFQLPVDIDFYGWPRLPEPCAEFIDEGFDHHRQAPFVQSHRAQLPNHLAQTGGDIQQLVADQIQFTCQDCVVFRP